jgi:sigma-B regulation protein RsbU (phosphoserine phosphatase)
MDYFTKRPFHFRILFGTLAAILVGFALTQMYMFGSSPTDENLFQNPPSSVMFIANVPAERQESSKVWVPDSIHKGWLAVEIYEKKFDSLSQAREYLRALPDSAMVGIVVTNPQSLKKVLYRLRKSSLAPSSVHEYAPMALVTSVTEGGASDRAGMKVGDLITRINGKGFTNVNEADRILRSGQTGKTIDYDILRDGDPIVLHVTLASFGVQFAFLLFFFTGFFYMAIGIFVALARPTFIAARLFGIFFLALGNVIAVALISRGLEGSIQFRIQQLTVVAGLFAAAPVFLHLSHYFPRERTGWINRPWMKYTGYALAVAGLIAMLTLPTNGVGFLLLAAILLFSNVVMFLYRKETPPEYKRINRAVKWTGMATGIISAAFGIAVSQPNNVNVLTILSVYGLLLLPLPISYLYTINRYRLLDLRLRIRRNVQYSFVSIFWTIGIILAVSTIATYLVQTNISLPYIRVSMQSVEVITTPPTQVEQEYVERGFLLGAAMLLTIFVSRAYRSGDRFIARKFHRSEYDYRRSANELADVMSSTLNMEDLARGIVEKLTALMQLKKAGILFFRDQAKCCCNQAHGFESGSWEKFCVSVDSDFVNGLRTLTAAVRVDYLSPLLKESLRLQEFHYVVPIRSKDKLVGAILIGEKLSEAPFQSEDIEFLGAVAKQGSVAIENAFLYEELTEQERLKHELAIARRIQLESLPQTTPRKRGLQVSGLSLPALEVGGDYFDYLNGQPGKLTVIIGDVSGKGTSAALYMSKVQGILRSLHGFGLMPRELFVRANHLLCGDMERKSFVTALGGTFDTVRHEVLLARAGHLPLYHFNAATSRVEKITPKGLGLGLSPEDLFANELEERTVSYGENDVFLFVTDGITEGQQTSGDEFGEERLLELLKSHAGDSAEAIRDRVLEAVKSFAGNANQHDDQTVVVVRVMPG